MASKIQHGGIEPWTLPRPYNRTMKAGRVAYLRDDPADVIALMGGANAIPPEIKLESVALAAVPAGGFDELDPFDDERFATVQTTNATETTIWSKALDDNTVYRFEAHVVARRTDAADRASYHRVCTVYRQAAGNATLQGAVLVPTTDAESDAAWDVTFDVSGTSLRLRVTGAAAKTIRWDALVRNILAST